ncbi:hypothetical protein L596_029722 [Steinernema carpocapsae]|uniref:Uncharacterized protein n=1 Tax=Steinernema carpocapsae TaxID=34508 RepID=A0A4U5LQL6_STECR|nr:hypothetical protein L596_029722 [Steinernema carpocapsae]
MCLLIITAAAFLQMARIATAPLMAALVLILCELAATKDLKVFRRGKVQIVDETQLNNPTEYSFDEDLQKSADLEDAYDELVPYLPRFDLIKNGKFAGYTRIPIVTRKQSTWSTPRPVTKKGEQYKTWGTPYIIPVTRPPRRFETKVRSEPVKVEERLPVQADSKEVSTILKTTTTVPTTTTTQSTTVPTTTTTQTTITDAPTTTSTSTEASTTPTQAPFRNEVIVKLENKFAQRFGVNRVIPNSATTPQTTIVINELIAKNNPLISASISASGFPVSTQQKVRSNQVILEPAPRNFPVPVKALPVASQPFVEATTRRPVPVAHPTPVKKVTTTSTEAPTTEALTTQATTTQAPLPSPCSKSLPCEGCAGSSPCSRRPSPIPLPSPCSSGSSFGSSPCSSPCSSSEASSPCATTLRPFRSRPRNPALGPAAPKPPIIHHGNSPYRGPTFNCRILNPVQDGRPHPRTDPTCALSMPGFSADGSCRCTYEVAGRDEDGCATGFLYICKRR